MSDSDEWSSSEDEDLHSRGSLTAAKRRKKKSGDHEKGISKKVAKNGSSRGKKTKKKLQFTRLIKSQKVRLGIGAFVLVLVFMVLGMSHRMHSFVIRIATGRDLDMEDSFSDGRSNKGKTRNYGPASWALKPDRERRKMSSAQMTEQYERFGASLKDKKPKFKIQRQIIAPETHKKTGKRTFGCLRDTCRGLALEDLSNRKWAMMYNTAKLGNGTKFKDNIPIKLTWLESDTTELTKLQKERPDIYNQAYKSQVGKTYLSVLEGADAIGGNKGQQLRTKESFVRKNSIITIKAKDLPGEQATEESGEGDEKKKKKRKLPRECTYNDLAIQPAQYRLYIKEECEAFLNTANQPLSFLLKPETGSQGKGITFHSGVESVKKKVKKFFPCKHNPSMSALERYLVQEYIERPLLLDRSKFDMRVYMLIASSDPWIVFYHQGYLRRSLFEYSASSKNRAVYLTNTHYQSMRENFKLSDHIWTFDRLQAYLTQNGVAGPHYVDSILDPYIKRVANFVFQSARNKMERRKGSFHIFGLDFMIDEKFRVHFIEANGYPGYTWSINFDTRGFVAEQFNLVMELHEHPTVFERMRAGDRYANFEMIFNELEETALGKSYDPCYEFYENRRSFKMLPGAMKRFSKYTGFSIMKQLAGLDDGECHSKLCKAKRRQAKKQASKARKNSERLFQGFVDDVQGAELIGGSKGDQVSLLSQFASAHKCSLNKLFVLPATYRMYANDDCMRALKYRTQSAWIAKPLEGRGGLGFEYFDHQSNLESRFQGCQNGVEKLPGSASLQEQQRAAFDARPELQFIVQKHITNRLKVKGQAWDIRAYMLIASTDPFFVFYHDGYVRSSRFNSKDEDEEGEVDEEGNIVKVVSGGGGRRGFHLGESEVTFADFQVLLSKEAKTGDYFMSSAFQTYAKQVMRLLFHASKDRLEKKKKNYQLFELNFVLDDTYTFWYVGANSPPQLSRTSRIVQQVLKPMQDDIKPLVLELNDTPEALAGMRYGDKYGGFRLVHSDYEFNIRNETYNPCHEFQGKWSLAKSAVLSTAKLHDYKTRVESASLRELKKYTKAAWDKCRQKGYKQETCIESESVRGVLAKQYEIYLDKSTIIMSADEQESKKQQDQREKEIEEYVEHRLQVLSGQLKDENNNNNSNNK